MSPSGPRGRARRPPRSWSSRARRPRASRSVSTRIASTWPGPSGSASTGCTSSARRPPSWPATKGAATFGPSRSGVGHRAGRRRHPYPFTRRRNPAATFPSHPAKTEEDDVQVTEFPKRPQQDGRPHRTPAQAKTADQPAASLVEQAEAVRASLKDALAKTSELITCLKQHHKQTKSVRAALASLRQLEKVGT